MSLVTGTLADFGLDPLTALKPVLIFRASSTGLQGINLLSSRKAVEVVPASNGFFEADLVSTDLISPAGTYYLVEIRYRDAETRQRVHEVLPWKLYVPPAGGSLADLLRVPANPALVWIGPTAPENASPGSWWLDDDGDLSDYDGQAWTFKANLRGPAGYNATGAAADDAAIAAFIKSEVGTTATATALSAAIVAGVDSSTRRANVLNAGAINSSTVDSSPAIQAAINAAAREIVDSQMTVSRTVIFPGGRYRLNSQIIHPPYVKVQFEGTTILETNVTGSAWWIAPLASDPANLAPGSLTKQQWMWGPVLSGNGGSVVFVNKGDKTNNTALELGVRADIGASNPMARYTINDVAIQGYNLGLLWNSHRNYISSFYRFHIESNDVAVQYGTGVATTDAGEKVTWYDSLFASCGLGLPAHHIRTDTVTVQLFGCSIDFVTDAFKVDSSAGYQSIEMFGGHLEGINTNTRYVEGRHGIVVSDVPSGYLRVGLYGVPFVTGTRVTQFHGKMRLNLDMDYRSTDLASGNIVNLCDSEVEVRKLNFNRHGQGARVSERLNVLRDSTFASDALGPIATSPTHWGMNKTNATAELIAYGSSKAIKVNVPVDGYVILFPKAKTPVRTGERVRLMLSANKPTSGASFSAHIRFYDAAGVELSRTAESTFAIPAGKMGAWSDPIADVVAFAPAGATDFVPYFTAASPAPTSELMFAAPYAVID